MTKQSIWISRIAVLLVTSVLAGEAALQLSALFSTARDEGGNWRAGSSVRILTLGDSHTYGGLVAEEASYPGHLQRILDSMVPGTYSVLNLGVPGMSTTQLRKRLPTYVGRYEPDLVVVWAGVNDVWNHADVDVLSATWFERLDSIAFHSRLYRFVRVNLNDRSLERTAAGKKNWEGTRARTESADVWADDATYTAHQGDIVEQVEHKRDGTLLSESAMGARATENLTSIARWLRDGGYPFVLIAYPRDEGTYAIANSSIRRAAAQEGVPLLESRTSIARIPVERQKWLWALHPNGPMYAEVARDLASLVVSLSK